MLIKLQDFKEGEIIPVQGQYDPKTLDMEFVDLHYTRPVAMEGTVEKGTDILTFRGHAATEAETLCARCLNPALSPLDKDFEFFYEIKGKDSVDATDDIRELFMLDHQLSYICKEDCKGLCPACGINKNEANCQCVVESPASLAQLKDIWKIKSAPAKGGTAAGGKDNHGSAPGGKKGAK